MLENHVTLVIVLYCLKHLILYFCIGFKCCIDSCHCGQHFYFPSLSFLQFIEEYLLLS